MKKDNRKSILTVILAVVLLITICFLVVAVNKNRSDKLIKIGVIDSLLDDSYLSKYNVVENTKIVKDTAINDHGVTVLSIIKLENNAKIYYASTLDSKLKANIDDIVKAIYWCVEKDVDVINMSFSTTEDNAKLKKAVEFAISKDVVIVASCINFENVKSYPAMYNGVISVSDVDNSKATVVVKGETYTITLKDGKVIKAAGTSCAAAFITNQVSKELTGKTNYNIIKKTKK
jgi:hypothetical protein